MQVQGAQAERFEDADGRATRDGAEAGGAADWCVDAGLTLAAMTTLELHLAIAQGAIDGSARVWREGMECWLPLDRVPELAEALGGATPTPEPVATDAGPRAPAAPDPTVRGVALGSLVAAIAIAAALIVPRASELAFTSPPARAAAALPSAPIAAPPAPIAAPPAPNDEAPPPAISGAAAEARAPGVRPPSEPRARREEPGQRRRRRGARGAQGW